LELVDATGLAWVRSAHPELVTRVLNAESELPAAALLIEFDNLSYFRQNRLRRRAVRILQRYAKSHHSTTNPQHQQELWSLVRSLPAAKFLAATTAAAPQPLPIIDDAAVPPQRLPEFLEALGKLLTKRKVEAAIWGSAGAGHLHVLPLLDLGKAKGRQQALKLMDEFYALVGEFGGTTTASQGDGRLRAPYLEKLYGKETYQLFAEVKAICDPHGLFAPHTKFGVTKKQLTGWLRPDYSWESAYDRLPPL
jgi:FAD/FMN-containing dehydrogenase